MMLVLLLILFCSIGLFLFNRQSKKRHVLARIKLTSTLRQRDAETSILKDGAKGRVKHPLLVRLDALFSRQDKGLILLSFVALPGAAVYWLNMLDWYWCLGLGFAAAFVLLGLMFVIRKRQQTEEFEQNIVQVLGLISRSVSAGLSVPQAISQVAHTQSGLLGREFSLIEDQLALGQGLRQALEQSCARLPFKAFRYFTVALVLNQSNGGQLRDILHSLSRTLHDSRAMQKKVKSLTSEPRMTARFLAMLPLVLLAIIAFINPTMFDRLIATEEGQSVLIYCALSILAGGLCLQALTKNRRFS